MHPEDSRSVGDRVVARACYGDGRKNEPRLTPRNNATSRRTSGGISSSPTSSASRWPLRTYARRACSDTASSVEIDARSSDSWSVWSWPLPAPGRDATPSATSAEPTSARSSRCRYPTTCKRL